MTAQRINWLLVGLVGGFATALGLAAFWFWPTPAPAVPALADVVPPEAELWKSAQSSDQPPGLLPPPDRRFVELRVVDDVGGALEPSQCAVSTDGKSWTPHLDMAGAVIRLPQPTSSIFLFVAAKGNLSRVALLSEPGPVVLPRLPKVMLQVDNGLGVGFGECQIEVSLKVAAFSDAGLRLPFIGKGQSQFLARTGQSVQLKTQADAKIAFDFAMPYWTYSARVIGGPVAGAWVDFSAQPGESVTVRVPFGGGPFIIGRIVGENGAPVDGADIRFSKEVIQGGLRVHHQVAATRSGTDGRFMLAPQFPQDRLDDELRMSGDGWLNVLAGEGQSGRSAQRRIEVAGNLTDVGDVRVGAGLTVFGRVFLGDRPAANIRVGIWTQGGVLATTSDESGYFSMSGLEASEKISVTASEKGYLPANVNVQAEVLAGKQIEIRLLKLLQGVLRIDCSNELLGQGVLRWRLHDSMGWKATDLRGQAVRLMEPGKYAVYLCTDNEISAVETVEITDSTETVLKPVLFPASKILAKTGTDSLPVRFKVVDADGHDLGFEYEVANAATRVIVVRPDLPHTIKSDALSAPMQVPGIAAGSSFQTVLGKGP